MVHITCALTDKGDVRRVNQDSLLIKRAKIAGKNVTLACVCDGLGGLSKGEVASAIATDRLAYWFESELPSLFTPAETIDKTVLYDSIRKLIISIHRRIEEYSAANGFQSGTTLAGVLILGNRFITINVGDSRVYMMRRGALHHLTKDQTFIQREIDLGNMTEEEAAMSPHRSKLLQCIGAGPEPTVSFASQGTQAGDLFVACSDGFHKKISEDEIAVAYSPDRIEDAESLERIGEGLIAMNRKRGETDNITVVSVYLTEEGR